MQSTKFLAVEVLLAPLLKRVRYNSVILFFVSLGIVAFGQPARIGWLGALSGSFGFALFFIAIPRHASKKQRFWWATVWFSLIQSIQLSWMSTIEFQGYYILWVYCFLCIGIGLQFGLFTLFIPSEGKLSKLNITSGAALWMLIEYARLYFICGFSWNPIGLALTHFIASLQFASVGGVFGLSFWIMLTNLSALNAWRQRQDIAVWLFLVAIPYLFGIFVLSFHWPSVANKGSIQAALIQTDLLPSQKIPYPGRKLDYVSPFIQWQRIIRGLKGQLLQKWDFVALPEAALPLQSDGMVYPFSAVRELMSREMGSEIEEKFPPFSYPFAEKRKVGEVWVLFVSNLFWCQTLANHFNVEWVVGLDYTDKEQCKNFNSAFCLKPQKVQMERYDKRVLLPLAEYLPYNFLRSLSKSYGINDFFFPGKETKVCGEKILFSPSICYEETFPRIMREGARKGAQLFVNVTNDNYFPNSILHEQHLYHARLRAVENGIPLIRACNSGVSAAVDCFGRIIARKDVSLNVEDCVLNCSVSSYTLPTLYSFWGDQCILSCSLVAQLLFWMRWVRKRQNNNALV